MVYIFGDLRQLRKFELSRPPISRPRALSNPRNRPVISSPFSLSDTGHVFQPAIIPISQPVRHVLLPQPLRLSIPSCPQPAVIHESPRVLSLSSCSSTSSECSSSSSSGAASISSSSASEGHSHAALTIEISPAFYDDSCIEGPATGSPGSPSSVRYHNFPSNRYLDSKSRLSVAEFTPTASFIHPYDPLYDDDFDDVRALDPEGGQCVEPFDFDLLPKRGYTFPQRDRAVSVSTNVTTETPSMVKDAEDVIVGLKSSKEILGRAQYKCNKHDVSTNPEKFLPSSRSLHVPSPSPRIPVDPAAQFKVIKAVPAFASPFTRVLNPVVTRAQWEIVVRSAVVAGIICWSIVGSLLAIPVGR